MSTLNQEVISKNLIFLDINLDNRKDIIQYITEKAHEVGYIDNVECFINTVMNRENEISTAIGYSIAIPHGKCEYVTKPFIAFLRSDKSFVWDEDNSDETVSLVFLIGVPKESAGKLHLKFISELSKKLLNEDFRNNLYVKSTITEIFEHLSSIEINK